jgi:hypothetical protein
MFLLSKRGKALATKPAILRPPVLRGGQFLQPEPQPVLGLGMEIALCREQ